MFRFCFQILIKENLVVLKIIGVMIQIKNNLSFKADMNIDKFVLKLGSTRFAHENFRIPHEKIRLTHEKIR